MATTSENLSSGFLIKLDSNYSAQLPRLAGILKFACRKFEHYTFQIYTETIKLCPLDVSVCQFQTYERISFKFSHYQL